MNIKSCKLPKIILPIIILIILIGVWAFKLSPQTNSIVDQTADQQRATATETSPQPQNNENHSGDGTMNLIRKVEIQTDQTIKYTFSVANLTKQEKNEQQIFTKTVGLGAELNIPHKSWSPDNKYVYLEEKSADGSINYFVFSAAGGSLAKDEPYLDVQKYFAQKMSGYSLREATGWASPILLNVTTNKLTETGEVSKGADYWFDVQAKAFWSHR